MIVVPLTKADYHDIYPYRLAETEIEREIKLFKTNNLLY